MTSVTGQRIAGECHKSDIDIKDKGMYVCGQAMVCSRRIILFLVTARNKLF